MYIGFRVSEPQRTEVHMPWIHNFKKYVVYTKSVPFSASVNSFFQYSSIIDKVEMRSVYSPDVNILSQKCISTVSMMLEYQEEQINRSRNRNWLCVNNALFEIVYSRHVHFNALWFGNAVPDVHQILHVMSILILGDVPGVSRSYDYFLIPNEITSGTPYVFLLLWVHV